MVDKFTLFELHLDDATFSNTVTDAPDVEGGLLEDVTPTLGDDESEPVDEREQTGEGERMEGSGRGMGPGLRMAAFAVVVAVGLRTLLRRLRDEDDDLLGVDDRESVQVDLDESVEA